MPGIHELIGPEGVKDPIYYYKRRDGKDYGSLEALEEADKAYRREAKYYIGRDGKNYSTYEELVEANPLTPEVQRQVEEILQRFTPGRSQVAVFDPKG
ncbi:MAG: hypothetical protein A3A51_00705 [Candidatus Levybacteria bacterium RIFCSPLOWO2_01_FULL_39_10]|nr:MAG: hypothetical protein A3A51_00705 [Candidatus Levybacteria bacterium RIFCSPLOWO2_01_FULL_39_10]